jgi:hypothetical protein
MTDTVATNAAPIVREFREILLWPLQLERLQDRRQIQKHWEVLQSLPGGSAWSAVQRFLYGEGPHKAAHARPVESSLKVFRRRDIAAVRIVPSDGDEPVVLKIAHIDLYFFYDVDVVILAVEVFGNDIPLDTAQDLLFRFGRAYPPYWESGVRGATCAARTEFLDAAGNVLAASDFGDRAKYLEFVCEHRAPLISSHWDFVMRPLVLHTSDEAGPLRYRQLEYYRMPVMAFLALDEPGRLTRGDYVRIGLLSGPGNPCEVPFSEEYLRGFEHRYCYDRHFGLAGESGVNATRMLTGGHNLIAVGNAASAFYVDAETGFLSQFRHQYFLLFLIAHLHKAALLMLSNRLAVAIQDLDIYDVESVKRFKRTIRQSHETFLRFTHRYWFHEVSIQVQAREIFAMIARHLETDELYGEVRDEMLDMESYLDSDNVRRQANVVVRLTVITTVGLIGTTATGFMGMNLIAEAENPLAVKLFYFALVFIPTVLLLVYTIVKSKRLSDFFEALSDERLGARDKLRTLLGVWARPKRSRARAGMGDASGN